MPKLLLTLLLIASACIAKAESKLHGSWKSDLTRTAEYLEKHSKLDEHQQKGVGILFGRTTITFRADGTGTIRKESFAIPTTDGRKLPMSGSESTFSYEILGESEGQVVIKLKAEDPATAKTPFLLLKFQDQDLYSIEIGENPFALTGREFYQRAKTDE